MNNKEETIQFLEDKLATYEKMKDSYVSQMDLINLKLSNMHEGVHKDNLYRTYEYQAEGLRGIVSYIETLNKRLEAIKNDPDYDDECKYSL